MQMDDLQLPITRYLAIPAGIAGLAIAAAALAFGAWLDEAALGGLMLITAGIIADAAVRLRRDRRRALQTQETVRESEERFRRLGNLTSVMMWTTDRDSRITFVSDAWARFTGEADDRFLSDEVAVLRRVVHPEDFERSLKAFNRSVAERGPFAIDYRLRRHDGVYRWMHDAAVPRMAGDDFAGYVGVLIDIDDRVRAQAALEASEQRLRTLVESVPLVQLMTDSEGTILLMQGRGLDAIGLRASEFIGRSALDVYRDAPQLAAGLRAALGGEQASCLAYILDRWWDVSLTPIVNAAGGGVSGVAVVGLEVTDREETKAALEESEMRYRLIASTTTDAIWDWDITTGHVWRSEGFSTRFGYAPEAVGEDLDWWQERVHPDDLPRTLASRDAFLEGVEANLVLEYRYLRADGTYARVVNRMHTVRNDDGRAVRVLGSVTDVTEQRQLEQRFLQAQKMDTVGRLAGGIAHDFSNLMTAIMVNAELDLMSPPSEEALREDLREIKETAERAANLSRRLLLFARREIAEPQVISVNGMILGAERMLQRLIGANIVVTINATDEATTVLVDRAQFEQVMLNLVVNARDAMPDGGELTLRTSRRTLRAAAAHSDGEIPAGDYVVVEVSDTGAGISEQVRRHVFEPFYTTKGAGMGTGLGLPTSYNIVRQAGGEMTVTSSVGSGSTFAIYLPFIDAPAEADRGPEPPEAPGGTETILLVEDEAVVRRSAARALRQLGYHVMEASEGREGLAVGRAFAGSIDLIVTDLVMPYVSGQELAQSMTELHPSMRVLFLSGYTDDAAIRESISGHTVDFIAKPFSPGALARKVREIIDRAPAGRARSSTAR